MLHSKLTNPSSIAVLGGSNDLHKPGGKLVQNLINGGFNGQLFIINPKEDQVQGIKCFKHIDELPNVDLAILAIPAEYCLESVTILADQKDCRGFIIISAGFSETNKKGKKLEEKIAKKVNSVGGDLIGPNCIGIINHVYRGVFTSPIPKPNPKGVDLISGSGATAVFLMESGMVMGLRFNEIYSVGNSAQTSVEDVLEHLDETYEPDKSARIKLLYLEAISNPQKLLKHASSLINKGCRIAAIKAGSSEAGIRAASSHTGALSSSDVAVRALFKKAGIVYCSGRFELITVASIFNYKKLNGKNIAVITHAGGSAVMLTDALEKGGLKVPSLDKKKTKELAGYLHPGSSVNNPIDFLATGTADQLAIIIDYCEYKFDEIDGMIVVFGSAGLFDVENVYKVLNVKMDFCEKPIYPVLPSLINAHKEIDYLLSKGRVNFPDETFLGTALAEVYHTAKPQTLLPKLFPINRKKIESILSPYEKKKYLNSVDAFEVLTACDIPIAPIYSIDQEKQLQRIKNEIPFPWVIKVSGPVHKTDVQGVSLNVNSLEFAQLEFQRMMKIKDADGIVIQEMKKGFELFCGAIKENRIGHVVMVGLGGIYIEILKDVRASLAPFNKKEAHRMIRRLKSYPLIKGSRGQYGTDEDALAEILLKLSSLLHYFPEISEIDLNPLIASKNELYCVDVRIKV